MTPIHRVTLIAGDGIGPAITRVARRLVDATGVHIEWQPRLAGLTAIQELGLPLPQETLDSFRETRVMLKAPLTTPVGTFGSGFRSVNVQLRQQFQLFANIRPIVSQNLGNTTTTTQTKKNEIDMVIVRENTEGLYAGEEKILYHEDAHEDAPVPQKIKRAESLCVATPEACERLMRYACDFAVQNNRKKITIVHKANILKATSGLFLDVARQVGKEYPYLTIQDLIVDACAMKMVRQPQDFDVVATTNLFGDILSDLAAGLPDVGGLGFVGSANLGYTHSCFEAIHGTAPDIAHLNIANPTAMILSSIMMLRHLKEPKAAQALESALRHVLRAKHVVTPDLLPGSQVSTQEMGDEVLRKLPLYLV